MLFFSFVLVEACEEAVERWLVLGGWAPPALTLLEAVEAVFGVWF